MQLTHNLEIRDISEVMLASMTEEEFANWQREQGKHIIYHRQHYWEEMLPGFYQPTHWMARLDTEQATRPTLLSWGLRAALGKDDDANASMPVHLLSNVTNYDLQSLSSNRRHNVRRCLKRVKIVEVISPVLLQEQGYEVILSALKRTKNPYEKIPSREEYLASLTNLASCKNQLVIAGLIGDKLGGYMTGYAVGETAYTGNIYIATEALSTYIGNGLIFEFVQACRRGKISEVCYGLHLPETPELGAFKEGMGFPVKHIPVKVQMNQIVEKFIRWRYPHKYYRLTGHS